MFISSKKYPSIKDILPFATLTMLALATGCDRADLDQSGVSDTSRSSMSKERQDQALMTGVVEGNPELWAAGSCAGACGGPAPDFSCWCSNDCYKHFDCCDDFAKECLAGGTPGSGSGSGSTGGTNKQAKVTILNVMASGSGCSANPRTGKSGYDYQIKGLPGVPNGSQFFAQMHSAKLQSQSDKESSRCQLTAAIQWTPGHRVVIEHANVLANMALWNSKDGSGQVAFSANAGSGPGNRIAVSRSYPWLGLLDEDFFDALNTHTSCSGVGYVTFTIDGNIRASNDKATADISHFNAGLRIAEPGETPDC